MAKLWQPASCLSQTGECATDLLDVPDVTCKEANDALITKIFWGKPGFPLISGNAAEWADRLSLTANDNDSIRFLEVFQAEMPEVDEAVKTTQWGSILQQETDFSITGLDERDNDAMYEFWRSITCQGESLLWFESGRHRYGGLEGIPGRFVSAYSIASANNIGHTWRWRYQWRSLFLPKRSAIPTV